MGDNSFALSPDESEYLDANYPKWDIASFDGAKSGVIISGFPLPDGYTAEKSDLLIIIPQGYPGAALDMFYFDPQLRKSSGRGIDKLATETHFNRSWQRWSRHYQWTPGEDNLVKHIEFVTNVLKQEAAQ